MLFSTATLLDCRVLQSRGFIWSGNVACMGIVLMLAGRGIHSLYSKYFTDMGRLSAMLFGCLFLLVGTASVFLNRPALSHPEFGKVVMAAAFYGNTLLFLLTALLMSMGMLLFAQAIKGRLFQYIGRNTLLILGTSSVFLKYIHAMAASIGVEKKTNLYCFFAAWVCILISVPVMYLCNRFVPNLLGRQEQ